MRKSHLHESAAALQRKYTTLYKRLEKAIHHGRFKQFSKAKQAALSDRLLRYERRLQYWGIAVASVTTLFLLPQSVSAQPVLPDGSEFKVNTSTTNQQRFSSIAMDSDGDFVVIWGSFGQDGSYEGIYGQRYNSSGIPQGSEFKVNTYTTDNQSNPSVAMDSDGDFVVTWESYGQDGSSNGIYGQRYNSLGVAQGSEFKVNTSTTNQQRFSSIAMDSDGDFVVTWASLGQDGSNYGIYGRRYNSLGIAQGGEFKVNTYTTYSQFEPSVAMDNDGDFVVTWQSYQDGSYDGIYGQRYNSSGVAQGSEFKVNTYTTNQQRIPSVAMDSDGDFVVIWASYGQDGSSYGIYGQRYNSLGVAQGSEFKVNTYNTSIQNLPSVAMDSDGDFVVTWMSYGQDGSSYGIYEQRYNSSGVVQSSEFKVNTFTTTSQRFPSVAMDSDGDYVVTWTGSGQDGSSDGIYAQRYTITSEFQVNTYMTNDQVTPAVAIDGDGDFVVTWQSNGQDGSDNGIYGQRYDSSGIAQSTEFRINTYTTSAQAFPSVAMDNSGDFVVTWMSYGQDGSNYGIYAQRYNNSGVAQGMEFRVNTYTTNNQRNPSVAMDSDGDFVVTWQSTGQDGSNDGIYAQRYNSSGVAQGSEFRVNAYTTNNQLRPSIAMDSDGDFVVTWQSTEQDGSNDGIYARRYNSSGVAQGMEFRANTYTTSFQSNPSVAMDGDGDFVVTWQSFGQDGSGYGIYGQRYNASGVTQGSEFRINAYTTNYQFNPSIAMDGDGDFVVTWQSFAQDGSDYGIYGQRYKSDGIPQSVEFRINAYTTSNQSNPSVAIDGDGDFVATWQSLSQDGSSYGIYGQRYINCLILLTNPLPIGTTNQTCAITIQANSQSAQEYDISSDVSITLLPNTHLVAGSDVRLFINGSSMPLTSEAPTTVATTLEARATAILVTDQNYPIIYPNPASEHIQVGLNEGEHLELVQIFDAMGKLVKTYRQPSTTISLEDLRSGWYILKMNINGIHYAKRMLKQ